MSSSSAKHGFKLGKQNQQEPGKFVRPPPESENESESSDADVQASANDDHERVLIS